MSHPPRDLTPLPDPLHDAALACPVRTRRPIYGDLLPPCNAGCLAGKNIQAWLASTGEHERAWRRLTAASPVRAIHGRVCYHLRESACNRAGLDSSVWIRRWRIAGCLPPLGPQPEPRPVGWTSARANGHDGEHQP